MGNGVGIEASSSSGKRASISFVQLEKLCKSGHFQQDHQQYTQALREAMLTDSLDYLEILLVAGDTKKALPLHLACSLGKLEAVELILSAGFSGDLTNKEGRNPLHMCCVIANAESGLCASLLCIQFPKSMRKLDYMGFSPLHFAAVQDNAFVLKAMVQHKADPKLPSQAGKTALELAKEHRCNAALQYLQSLSQNGGSTAQPTASNADVSQDRIMEIWERFFENAFKKAGIDMECEEEFDPVAAFDGKHKKAKTSSRDSYKAEWNDFYNDVPVNSSAKSKKSKTTSNNKRDTSYDYKLEDDYWMQSDAKPTSKKDKKKTSKSNTSDFVEYEDDFLQWIMFYNDSTSDQQYFLINKWSKESRWLEDHMNTMYAAGHHFRFLYEPYEDVEAMPYPTCLNELKNYGWITFYSESENYCMWMNMITGKVEYFLPLGMYEDTLTLQQWGMSPSEHDASWFEADQSCATSWTMVLTNELDEHNQPVYYFFNQITSVTSWDEPIGWDALVISWDYWVLCCTEDNFDQTFW